MQERIARLPVWAQDHIKRLHRDRQLAIEECAKLRRELGPVALKAQRMYESNEALLEILRCAGRGGSDLAKQISDTLSGYSIFQNGKYPEDE